MRITTRAAILIGVTLAVVPAACGLGGDGGGASPDDPSDSTVFRTITVAIDTSSPTTAAPAGPTPSIDQSAVAAAGDNVYVVQPGDAWWFIADKLGVSADALLAANRATVQTWLHPGDKLVIPGASGSDTGSGEAASGDAGTAPPVVGEGTNDGSTGTYKIQPGDGWIPIATKLKVDVKALLAANGATLKTPLYAGEYLRVPTSSGG